MTQGTPPPPAVSREVTNFIALEPSDWASATWRPCHPVPRPAPPPFSRISCLDRLRRAAVHRDWARIGVPERMTGEEAHFWLVAMTEAPPYARLPAVANVAERRNFDGAITPDEILRRIEAYPACPPLEIVRPLVALLAANEYVDVMLDPRTWSGPRGTFYQRRDLLSALAEGFRRYVLVHLDHAEREQVRERIRARLDLSAWMHPGFPPFHAQASYRLAAVAGLSRELLPLVAGWPNGHFSRRDRFEELRCFPHETILGLGDARLVEQHFRRLGLLLRHEADARAWLAHLETNALDLLVASVRATGGDSGLIAALCLVRSPAAARPLLELRTEGFSCPALREWFEREVGNAAAGLVPVAGQRGRLGDAARAYLRDVRRRGLGAVIETQLGREDAATARRLRRDVLDVQEAHYPPVDEDALPDWLWSAFLQLPKLGPEKLPDWLALDDLPPLVVAGKALRGRPLATVVKALRTCEPGTPPVLFRALRDKVDAAHREAFAWRLIEQWRCHGAGVRDCWALSAVGVLCGDESVLPLVGLMRDWSGPDGRERTLHALGCLRAIGTPLALQQLQGLSRQLRSRPLRDHARDLFVAAARGQGLSQAELEDQAVPDLGFTGVTGPTFDFGPRRFQAVLAPGLRLAVRDEAGNVRDTLPEPGVRDDATRARRAAGEWRLLRKTLREVYREQGLRLERAMVQGRRWPARHFRQRVLARPLLAQLARLVLWGGYDDRARLAATFRVTEDLEFVDAEEAPVSAATFNSLRVVHPIELAEQVRMRWLEVWRDHDLLSPFPQLGRKLYPLDPARRGERRITTFGGRKINTLTLSGLVRNLDWWPACLHGGGSWQAHARYFPQADLTAVIQFALTSGGYAPGHLSEHELKDGFFVRGERGPGVLVQAGEAVPLGDVPVLVWSEVCEVMALIHAKGREV